ncbi:hypothetical protein MIMGU_mgv1a012250mg [Erythranthe guttata]|uniref:F-box domain-containing protein n=1 Tax=Erythranthe guttata TaxID=4155 RepID=A0A022R012_ERYGU|nr:hypothetical protein MIMGU_mgv1a012250mg [Erythranthe guttata]
MAAAGVKSKDTLRRRSRPYYFRVCKRNKNSQIMDSLPDELLFHILLQLPAEDIPNAAVVCRKWYRTTRARDFVHAHRSHHSVSGLVIHELTTDRLNCHPPDTHTHVLTLNVDTETMTKYTLPQSPQGGYERRPKFYFSAGKSLSLFVLASDLYLEGWDMKSESGEWTKLYNIDFTPRKCEFERFHSDKYSHVPFALLPFGWIKFREVLAFHFSYPSSVCTAYNLVTQEFHFFELGSDARYHEFVPHTINYLEWLST